MMCCLRVEARIVLRAILLVSLSPLAFAADWPAITPEEQALKDVAEQPGAPSIIMERQEIADDLNNFHSTFKRIKILTEEGRKYADVELPYNRHGFSIGDISGRTVHPDGTVIPFEGKPFDKAILSAKQQDYWKAQGKFWNKDVESFLGKKKGVEEAVAPLTAPNDTLE